ncbi:MAG: (2Fe-2S)-binding protein [Elusimicrobiota bacterium]
MKKYSIEFKLNGDRIKAETYANKSLLDFLRNDIGIKSPKVGCDRGDCGACTVLINGKTVRACLVLAVEADGCEIVTLEGSNKNKITQKLQKKFHEKNAFQCGFCAPGVILSATELLSENPSAGREEIKEAISGNLCRCTGYEPIVDAIEETVKKS